MLETEFYILGVMRIIVGVMLRCQIGFVCGSRQERGAGLFTSIND